MLSQAHSRRISMILVVALLSTLLMPIMAFGAAPAQFTDIADSYAQEEIQALAEAGIIAGYEDDTFQPHKAMTRAELAKIIVLSLGLRQNPDKAAAFADVGANVWYRGYVGALVESGITEGTSLTAFSPDSKVTREELAVFFIRAMGLEESAEAQEATAKLADWNEISKWAQPHVSLAFQIGFIKGIEMNGEVTFNPKENTERQALARLAYEFKTNKAGFVEKAKEIAGKQEEEAPVKTDADTMPIIGGGFGGGFGGGSGSGSRGGSSEAQVFAVDSVQALDNHTVKVVLTADIESSEDVKAFGINGGLEIAAQEPKVGTKIVELTTSSQTVGQTYQLSYGGADTGKTFVGQATSLTEIDAVDYEGSYKVTQAGTFGPANGTAVINGNFYVEAEGVILRNVEITGNLVLGEEIGEGDVTLTNITVDGQTIVNGGGPNSIHLQNTVLVSIIVDKRSGAVRLVAEGASSVGQVTLQSNVILEESETLSSVGFRNIDIAGSMPANSSVELKGTFETVDVIATNIAVTIPSGFVNALNVRAEAANTNIHLGDATITSLLLNAMAAITGNGIVEEADINASGTSFERMPNRTNVGEGAQGPRQAEPSENTNQLRYITLSNGEIGVTFNRTVTDAVYDDFVVTATLAGQDVRLDNLAYHSEEQKFTFDTLPADGSLQTLQVQVAPSPSSTKFSRSASSSIRITGFEGTIYDVQNHPVSGITIKFRDGIGSTVGPVIASVTTDDYGHYKVTLPSGSYTGELLGEGFITTYLVGVAADNVYNHSEDATAIRIAAAEETRIVLVWGEHPRDLDSHLVGPTPDAASQFHTWYGDREYRYNTVLYDDLDHDDVTSYGPETTTIRRDEFGTYRFYVHHYSGSATLRTSGAQVKIYRGNSTEPVRTYTVPEGDGTERYWTVFEMTITESGVAFNEVNELFASESQAQGAAVNLATVISSIYDVDQQTRVIGDVPSGLSVDSFKAGLIPADGATFQVYESDGTTVKTGEIASGDKVIVTAANGITKKTYIIEVETAAQITVTGLVYDPVVTVTGATYQFSLSANFSDGTPRNITHDASWSSSEEDVAVIDEESGYLSVVSNGSTVVTATYGNYSADYHVTVNTTEVTMSVDAVSTSGDVSVTQQVYGPLENEDYQFVIPNTILDADLNYVVVTFSDSPQSDTLSGSLDFSQASVRFDSSSSSETATFTVNDSVDMVIAKPAGGLNPGISHIVISGLKKTVDSHDYEVEDIILTIIRE